MISAKGFTRSLGFLRNIHRAGLFCSEVIFEKKGTAVINPILNSRTDLGDGNQFTNFCQVY